MLRSISSSADFFFLRPVEIKAGIPSRLTYLFTPGKRNSTKILRKHDLRPAWLRVLGLQWPVTFCVSSACMASLFTSMSLAWFSKGKGKDRDAKDRPLNGHRFNTGACLGPTVCVVCNKPASGKDLLHCSGK